MYCQNCGKGLNQNEIFCSNCGAKVENRIHTISNNNMIQNNQTQMNNINQQVVGVQQQPGKSKNNNIIIVLAIIGGVVVGFIILVVMIILITSASSEKLVCKSDEGNITLMYDESGLNGYKANGLSYDLDSQKEYAKEIGIDAYIIEFNNWFVSNTSGSCTIDGEVVSAEKENQNESDAESITVVGDNEYGYITIPNTWVKFYDIAGNTSLQYSYANVYIVSLDYFEDSQYTAKEYASNYMYNMQNSSDVTGVSGATVKIGKNKEYTAYQVYMYYPDDDIFLVTYWFEAEDGKVHYIALEGPEELGEIKITDYLYIAESFSLNK